jgi:uncharacterized protein (TIGR02145 family)
MYIKNKRCVNMWAIVGMVTLLTLPRIEAEPLTTTQLHATMGIVTNFILSDGIVHNGTSYGTITSPYTGKVWLDRNLGANRACMAIDDTECYGDYYQWGRGYDGHQEYYSSTTIILSTDVDNVGHGDFIKSSISPRDWASVDYGGAIRSENWLKNDGTSICPIGFRVPTHSELFVEVFNDPGSSDSFTRFDIYNDFLKLPSAGLKFAHSASFVANIGNYWTSTSTPPIGKTMRLTLKDSALQTGIISAGRGNGCSVRCIKDNFSM